MRDSRTSPLAFAREILTGWISAVTGVASALLLLVALFVDKIPPVASVLAAILCFYFSAYEAWKRERVRANSAANRLASAFRFDSSHQSCRMPEGNETYYRVALYCTGVGTVNGVQVRLAEMNPSPTEFEGKYPIPLHVMHDFTIRPFDLPAGEPALIDLFVYSAGSPTITVFHNVSRTVPVHVPVRRYEFTLEVVGHDAPPLRRSFVVDPGPGGLRIAFA